ncbi:hypothetical protein HNP98_001145 [Hymenobacter sp. 9A]|uniref:Uncharacterized protein n=1 Tax=Hymenobacter caeli TaxID=2735894 RepID=A0ABX2FMD7_9BACT|nr:hypothetical protein [Hymenobacter caeli]
MLPLLLGLLGAAALVARRAARAPRPELVPVPVRNS